MKNPTTIRALFVFPGFTAASNLLGVFGDRYVRVIQLKRRKKQRAVRIVGTDAGDDTTKKSCAYGIFRLPDGESIWSSSAGGFVVRGVMACM